MKQHITPQQVSELSDKGKERLRAWWKPGAGDLFFDPCLTESGSGDLAEECLNTTKLGVIFDEDYLPYEGNGETYLEQSDDWSATEAHRKTMLPLLSIGQMIEFLRENTETDSYTDGTFDHQIGENHTDNLDFNFCISWNGEELCDVLWNVTKQVLEKGS